MIYTFCSTLLRIIYTILFRLEAVGRENIPKEGGVLLCSNHISNFDPPTVGIKLRRQVRFMAKSELFEIPVLGRIIKAVGAFPLNVEVSARNPSKPHSIFCVMVKCLESSPREAVTMMEVSAKRGSEFCSPQWRYSYSYCYYR